MPPPRRMPHITLETLKATHIFGVQRRLEATDGPEQRLSLDLLLLARARVLEVDGVPLRLVIPCGERHSGPQDGVAREIVVLPQLLPVRI